MAYPAEHIIILEHSKMFCSIKQTPMQRVRAAAAEPTGTKLMHESCMRRGSLALYHILQRSKDTDVSLKQRQ